ncbi:hypothetical protein HDV00_002516 [Rhizophlyctis rosea]|nr:hypothetical protein HDV00_002516 [Rhizophlyctis rosea]
MDSTTQITRSNTHSTTLPPGTSSNAFSQLPNEVNDIIFRGYVSDHLASRARDTGLTGNLLDLLLTSKLFNFVVKPVRRPVAENQAAHFHGRLETLQSLIKFQTLTIQTFQFHNETYLHPYLLPNYRIYKNPFFSPIPYLHTLTRHCDLYEDEYALIHHATPRLPFKTYSAPRILRCDYGEASSTECWDEVDDAPVVMHGAVITGNAPIRVLKKPKVVIRKTQEELDEDPDLFWGTEYTKKVVEEMEWDFAVSGGFGPVAFTVGKGVVGGRIEHCISIG